MAGVVQADDQSGHRHDSLFVRSRPVIERLPLQVIDPVDVVLLKNRSCLVADRAAGTLFRLNAEGHVELLADKIHGVQRICAADSGIVYVQISDKGDSDRILQLSAKGTQQSAFDVGMSCVGLACDDLGNLYTANQNTGQVLRIDSQNQRHVLDTLSEPVADVTLDALQNPVVLLKSGTVVWVAGDGASEIIGYVPAGSQRIEYNPADDVIVALGPKLESRTRTLFVTAKNRDDLNVFAQTPRGTVSFQFDHLGNLTLANPDLRALTRVTSRFQVECPHEHCSHAVLMVFSSAPPDSDRSIRNF